jgi:hypothetical protein
MPSSKKRKIKAPDMAKPPPKKHKRQQAEVQGSLAPGTPAFENTLRKKESTSFLSLPRELRHQILFESFEGCWTEIKSYKPRTGTWMSSIKKPHSTLITYTNGKWGKDRCDGSKTHTIGLGKLLNIDERLEEDVEFVHDQIKEKLEDLFDEMREEGCTHITCVF